MQETEVQKILKYYLEYEVCNVANSSKIEVDNKKSIIIEKISNIKQVCKSLNELREIKIVKEVENFIGRNVNNKQSFVQQIISELKELDINQSNKAQIFFRVKNLVQENIKYKREEKIIDNFINKLCDIQTSKEFWLYADNITALHKNKVKKLPIFIFKCNMEIENIEVVEVNVNTETLVTVLSTILNKEISEVVLEYEEQISNYVKELKILIDAGDIEHLLNLYYSKLQEYIGISKEAIKNIQKVNSKYHMSEEYIVAIDELAEEGIKNIKEDIETLTKIINYDGYVPKVLNKYLCGNQNKKDINYSKYTKIYRGNYKSKFGINENQYKIVNSIKDNDLIAIEGPPGTGKTSLLKEIISNNIVERANLILNNWNKSLEEKNYYETNYYDINWYSKNENIIKSIVVSSKNGEAIENVGKEINREIRYMFPIARKYKRTQKIEKSKEKMISNYKGLVCLPLGKQDNIQDFKEFLYKQYIPLLEKISLKKGIAKYIEKIKKKYEAKIKKIEEAEELIGKIIEKIERKETYFYEIQISPEDTEEQIKNKIQQIQIKFARDKEIKKSELENLKNKERILTKEQQEKENQLEIINKQICNKEKQIEDSQKLIVDGKNDIEYLKNRMQHFEMISKNIVTKIFNYKEYKENKNINFINEINEIVTKNEIEDKKISYCIQEKSKLEKEKIEIKDQYEELSEKYKDVKNNNKTLEKRLKEIELIESFNKWNKWTYWNYASNLEICGKSHLSKLNQELFELALKLNEAYIMKNSKEIIENLKLFLPEETSFVCQKFYDSTEIYSNEKQEGIRSLWNTLFLCFPVVTTTLDSFSKRCFHLIPEYIDLELIDEAGQILPHNLVSAIYRAKKAVIVGDVNQIEPIYNNINKDFSKSQKDIGEKFEDIKISTNSIQTLANKNTDILNNNENIILNDHYRCEENIINFSNENIYQNKLNMHKKDEKNKPFLDNMIALDIRGKKEKNNYANRLEIDSCIETIKYIKENNNEEATIAIITPFKKQKQELEDRLRKEELKDIKVGTVHAFQGQEKDYIIFSQVIDSLSNKNIVNFIGKKCNMLNVAVTRAKKQFIYLGNLEIAIKADNYMSKLIKYINKNGLIYSLYNMENTALLRNWDEKILQILAPVLEIDNDNIGLYISKHTEKGIIKDAKQHYELLKYAIKNAKSEICIMAPWIRKNVIDDEFINDIKKLKENNCKIKIIYGYKKVNADTSSIEELVNRLKQNSALGYATKEEVIDIIKEMNRIIGKENFLYKGPIHAKILIVDGKYMLMGSHNWLSNAGKTVEIERAIEGTRITTNREAIDYAREEFFGNI